MSETPSPPPPKEAMEKLLSSMAQLDASDLHLKVGYPPAFRIQGELRAAKMPPIENSSYIDAMMAGLAPEHRMTEFEERGALDFSARGKSGDRFRMNMYRSMGETHASVRRVQSTIPSFKELHLPPIYEKTIAKTTEGLILVSGVTGSGKSTTLAALLEKVNELRSMHIITIEDPIEFTFKPKRCIISQREIGIDVSNYPDALRYVVRQDPDCILIGEMRDKETMLAALQAAETGHLVMGTLHVADVQQTFVRVLEFFPRSQHSFIRSSLANSLQAIFCQRLLPGIDPGTRYPATEVLLRNPVVKEKIVHEKDEEIPHVIQQNREDGMRSFTQSLCELIEKELVHYDTAMDYAPNREALASAVKGITAA